MTIEAIKIFFIISIVAFVIAAAALSVLLYMYVKLKKSEMIYRKKYMTELNNAKYYKKLYVDLFDERKKLIEMANRSAHVSKNPTKYSLIKEEQ